MEHTNKPAPVSGSANKQFIDPLDDPQLSEVSPDEQTLETKDPRFQSELEYEGYEDLEDSDNNAYNLHVDKKADSPRELIFNEREDSTDVVEENLIDPQGNND